MMYAGLGDAFGDGSDGGELSAYNAFGGGGGDYMYVQPDPPPMQAVPVMAASGMMQPPVVQSMQQQQQQAMQPPVTALLAQPSTQMQVQVQAQQAQAQRFAYQQPKGGVVAAPPPPEKDPGYFETLWVKRKETTKLIVLALVILLAISGHSAIWHYVKEYVESAVLTQAQEVAVRLAYPLAVLFVLWNVKAFLVK
jgi:hypothetical protein